VKKGRRKWRRMGIQDIGGIAEASVRIAEASVRIAEASVRIAEASVRLRREPRLRQRRCGTI
jgi:hypothetical protein